MEGIRDPIFAIHSVKRGAAKVVSRGEFWGKQLGYGGETCARSQQNLVPKTLAIHLKERGDQGWLDYWRNRNSSSDCRANKCWEIKWGRSRIHSRVASKRVDTHSSDLQLKRAKGSLAQTSPVPWKMDQCNRSVCQTWQVVSRWRNCHFTPVARKWKSVAQDSLVGERAHRDTGQEQVQVHNKEV